MGWVFIRFAMGIIIRGYTHLILSLLNLGISRKTGDTDYNKEGYKN
jgi:hypothetical protein